MCFFFRPLLMPLLILHSWNCDFGRIAFHKGILCNTIAFQKMNFLCVFVAGGSCFRSISGSISVHWSFYKEKKYFIFQQLDQIRRNNSKQKRSQGKENFYGIAIFSFFFSGQCHSFTLFCSIFHFYLLLFFLCHSLISWMKIKTARKFLEMKKWNLMDDYWLCLTNMPQLEALKKLVGMHAEFNCRLLNIMKIIPSR